MMDLFNNNPTCWSQLTLIQRNEGISPKELDDLVFDVNIKKLTNLDKLKLEFFFAGCSLAFSKEECQAYICKLIDSTSEMRPIRQIAGKHFDSSCKPKEHIIPKDTDGVFIGPHLDGEGNGTEHRSYLDLFCSTYTTLIENKLAHLMHRSRIKDLVSYLGNDEKAKTLAARLISYRCYGHHGLQIVEYKRELLSLSKKKKKLTELLEHSEMKELNYFKDHHKGMLERLEGITNMQEHVQNQLLQENKDWKKNLQLYYFPVQSYKPGNFSFIIDEVHQKLLTNAYTAITDLNEWSFFGMVQVWVTA